MQFIEGKFTPEQLEELIADVLATSERLGIGEIDTIASLAWLLEDGGIPADEAAMIARERVGGTLQ